MQDFPTLQAADIVAYEMYKEYERRLYRPQYKPRFGYEALKKMSERFGFLLMFRFYEKAELARDMREAEQAARIQAYWEKRRKQKDAP